MAQPAKLIPTSVPTPQASAFARRAAPTDSTAVELESTPFKHADGMRNPTFAADKAESKHGDDQTELDWYRIGSGVMSGITFLFATIVAITALALLTGQWDTQGHIYSSLKAGATPFVAKNYSLGWTVLWTLAVIALLEFAAHVAPPAFAIIEQAINTKRVNGVRTILDILSTMIIGWFAMQVADANDWMVVTAAVFIRVFACLFFLAGERENSDFAAAKIEGGSEIKKKSYYWNFIFGLLAELVYLGLFGTKFIDTLTYDNATLPTTGNLFYHMWCLIAIGLADVLYTLATRAMALLRYARFDTTCITPSGNYELSHMVLRNFRSLIIVSVLVTMGYYMVTPVTM